MQDFNFTSAPAEVSTGPISSLPISPSTEYSDEVSINTPSEVQPNQAEETIDFSKYFFGLPNAQIVLPKQQLPSDDTLFIDIEILVGNDSAFGKITKRIKLCKKSLINEVAFKDGFMTATATYVEQLQEQKTGRSPTQRMLELAGISHPKNFV